MSYVDPNTGQQVAVPTSSLVGRGPINPAFGTVPEANIALMARDNCDDTGNLNGTMPLKDNWYTLAKVDPSKGGNPITGESTYVINVNTCPVPSGDDPYVTPNTNSWRETTNAFSVPNCEGTEVNNFALRTIILHSGSPGSVSDVATSVSCSNSVTIDSTTHSPTTIQDTTSVEPDRQGDPPASLNVPQDQPQVSGLGRVSVQVSVAGTQGNAAKSANLPGSDLKDLRWQMVDDQAI